MVFSRKGDIAKWLFLLFVIVVSGCQRAAQMPESDSQEEASVVTLSLDGLFEQQSDDLIAVQIYSVNGDVVDVYGYGLFDSYNFAEVELLAPYSYYFLVSVVRDGQNKIMQRESSLGVEYYRPFSHFAAVPLLADNQFYVSNSTYFPYLNQGTAMVVEGVLSKEYRRPSLERYVGCSELFTPTEERATVDVELRRVYGCFELKAEGLNVGSLTFKFDGAPDIVLTPEVNSLSVPISLAGSEIPSMDWTKDGYEEELSYSIVYTSNWGEDMIFVRDAKIVLGRGKIQPINIQSELPVDITITIEQGEMEILPEIVL